MNGLLGIILLLLQDPQWSRDSLKCDWKKLAGATTYATQLISMVLDNGLECTETERRELEEKVDLGVREKGRRR